MKTLRYNLLTLVFSVLVVNLLAQGSMTIQSGGAVTVNGNTIITSIPFNCGGILTDNRDGKTYETVQIGTQCWMQQNLNIGIRVDGVYNQTNNSIIEKYCYDDNENNCNNYGGLYQWDETMQYSTTQGVQGICPSGWHLPTDAEWTTLTTFLGGESVAGGEMKEAGTSQWSSPNTGATNGSGFTALPGGSRDASGAYFGALFYGTEYWSSFKIDANFTLGRHLSFGNAQCLASGYMKATGVSVRCLMD